MNIQAVIFDMDGVLFDTERVGMKICMDTFKTLGYNDVTEEIILKTIGRNRTNEENVFKEYIDSNFDYQKYIDLKVENFHEYICKYGMPKKDGILELLQYLKINKHRLAVATSSYEEEFLFYMEHSDIYNYFDAYVCGDMIQTGKPHPEIYQKAAQLLDIEPDCCIAVEDSPAGMMSAHKAGMYPIMVPDIIAPTTEIAKLAYKILPNANEIISVLSSL